MNEKHPIARNASFKQSLRRLPVRLSMILAGIALIAGLIAYFALRPVAAPSLSGVKVTLALPTQINSAPALIAFDQGLFRKAGVEVVNQPFLLGKDALNSLLVGKADLAVVADTPFVMNVLGGQDIAILAGISQARRALAIVARGDRHIEQISDLAGKSVALTLGTNFPYFLDSMLHVNRLSSDSVKRVDLKTPAVIKAFKDGDVDAAVVFQPFLAQLEAEMGDDIKVFHGEDVYAFRFLLVSKPAYIDSHPQEIRQVVRALADANTYIRDNPLQARLAIGKAVKVDDQIMARLFDAEDYVITLDQAMLLALDDQTRWAMQQGLARPGPVPNYLNFVNYQALEAVLPAAVRIVH